MATEPAASDLSTSDLIEVRRSNVHGLGVFAAKHIPKGTRIIEYLGERVSHAEADRRYEEKDANDSHTFLFIVDSRTVIDAGVDGNDARFFNHSCDPNCESTVDKRRVYIEAIRDVEPGAELTYDYQIQREDEDPDNIDEIFACRCGFAQCRGTMLWPTERKPRRTRSRKKARNRSKSGSRSQARSGARDSGAARGKSKARGKSDARRAATRRKTTARGKAAAHGNATGRGKASKRSVGRASGRRGHGGKPKGSGRRRGRR